MQEFWCLPNGIIYYITIPSMYLFLMIYSVFNLNVVSWGTREVAKKLTAEELAEQEAEKEKAVSATFRLHCRIVMDPDATTYQTNPIGSRSSCTLELAPVPSKLEIASL